MDAEVALHEGGICRVATTRKFAFWLLHRLFPLALAMQLTACFTPNLDSVGGKTCFTHTLAREYRQLSYALKSGAFGRKSDDAVSGKTIAPIEIEDPYRPKDSRLETVEFGTGEKLLKLLEDEQPPSRTFGGVPKARFPMELAHAQGRFDCWVITTRWGDVSQAAACHDEFQRAICYIAAETGHASSPWTDKDAICSGQKNSPFQITDRAPFPWEC